MASTRGCPYMIIVETAEPIHDLGPDDLRVRAEMMISSVIDGLTLPPAELVRRLKDVPKQQIHPHGIVRSSVPI